ncbi:hypothetical protein MMC13_000388 [Lambiella insularis]|nr:hypothetical protein [Lambiella insularis]
MASHTIAVINGTSRTFTHLIPQALNQGHKVRAIVRSASRFLAKTQKHDNLSVHEWSDFSDVAALGRILDGVDVIYVALASVSAEMRHPSFLNQDALVAICTVLYAGTAPSTRCSTKVVLLSSTAVRPGGPGNVIGETLLFHQLNDLRRAQSYLLGQSRWLDVVVMVPGMLLDSEDGGAATAREVRIKENSEDEGPISYARLAAGMQLAAADKKWVGKAVVPVPTGTKVPSGLKYMGSAVEVMRVAAWYEFLPWLLKRLALALVAGLVGFALGRNGLGSAVVRHGEL